MRILALVVVSAIGVGLARQPHQPPPLAEPAAAIPALMAETQPSSRPAKADAKTPSVDAEIKALGLKSMNINTAMGRLKTAKLESKLKDWSGSGAASEFAEARKAGVLLAGMAKVVEWKKNKKRSKDAAAYDQITTDLESSARKLAEAAGNKDADAVKAAADEVSRRCSDCHSRFK